MAAAFVLPGQGDYLPGCIEEMSLRSPVARAEVAGARELFLTDTGVDIARFFAPDTPPLAELARVQPELSQYLCFVSSLAAARVAEDEHGPPSVVVGHSLGEIAALCAGGYLSTADGARVVVRRTLRVAEALAGLATGLLAVIGERDRAVAIVDVLPDEGLSVAGYNGELQIVISGPDAALDRYANLATAINLRCVRLVSPWAFHNPMLTGAAVRLQGDLAGLRLEQGTPPIYSPILERFYRPGEVAAAAIASHLVRPFHFDRAIVELSLRGYRPLLALGSAGTLRFILEDGGAKWPGVEDGGSAPIAGPGPAAGGAVAAPTMAEAPRASITPSAAPLERASLLAHLQQMYATALEYPPDVFDEQVDLEADLGVDSVKQTELLSRVSEHYDLPAPTEEFRVGDYPTLGHIVDLVVDGVNTSVLTVGA